MTNSHLLEKLESQRKLSNAEWIQLISTYTESDAKAASELAHSIALSRFGRKIYFRGIIEFTNICKNDCLYCGIRKSNGQVSRYRLTKDDILSCCDKGYKLGYRTFVLQGGEDGFFDDKAMTDIVKSIRESYSECAITLSIGERSRESYKALYEAGADRYLLRHETASKEHYSRLHPSNQSFDNRMRCLYDLKEIGYQVGCGMMVGSPYQTPETLAEDMEFMCKFNPAMVGMGPFIPHKETPFCNFASGDTRLTLFLLSLVRIMLPDVLLPATTALGTLDGDGRKNGVLCGCNVVMPNLSPLSVRKKYMLYDNKAGTENDAKSSLEILRNQMKEINYEVIVGRGDYIGREKIEK